MSLFFSPPLPLSAVLCVLLEGESTRQRALWVLEVAQRPSPESSKHPNVAKSLVLGWKRRMGEGTWRWYPQPQYPQPRGAAANGWRGLPQQVAAAVPSAGSSQPWLHPMCRAPGEGSRCGSGDMHALVSTGNQQCQHRPCCHGVGRKARGNACLGCGQQ